MPESCPIGPPMTRETARANAARRNIAAPLRSGRHKARHCPLGCGHHHVIAVSNGTLRRKNDRRLVAA